MQTIRLTTAQAIVRYLIAQRTTVDGEEVPLFPGVFAIFGHGNVTSLGEALEPVRDRLPVWRGQNEQTMAMAAVAFAKAKRRRQVMIVTTSIGPGAANVVTAAGIAHADRLPLLVLSGDTFTNRIPDPVLQQVEHFDDPTTTVNDAFRAVTRFWDRITHPAQVLHSLPHAVATMVDPAECGPAFIGLPQDVQAQAFDYPEAFFEPRVHRVRRPGSDAEELADAAAVLRGAQRPLVIAGGGVHYSLAADDLASFVERHRLPVAETVAGKSSLRWDHPNAVGPIGVTGGTAANALAADADVVLAVGTRLQDFTTGSWSVFRNDRMRLIALNTARFDATKHLALPLVADARRGLEELTTALGDHRAPDVWISRARDEYRTWNAYLDTQASAPTETGLPSYAAVVRAVNEAGDDGDYALDGRRRAAGRAEQALAVALRRVVRLRIRVQLHGVRDRRGVGRGDGHARQDSHLVLRGRLVSDGELGGVQLGSVRTPVRHRVVRQRRVRGYPPAAGVQGRRRLQQHDRGLQRP